MYAKQSLSFLRNNKITSKMSLDSDLLSEDLQLSPSTLSEKYTDDEYSVFSTIPESPSCECFQEHQHECIDHDTMLHSAEEKRSDGKEYHHCSPHCGCSKYDHRFRPRWSTNTMSDDGIEVLNEPEYLNQFEEVYYIEPSLARGLLVTDYWQHYNPNNARVRVDTRTKRQRNIARAVMIVCLVMFMLSALLVVISLVMSDHIDNLVRSSNSRLLKGKPSTVHGGKTILSVIKGNYTYIKPNETNGTIPEFDFI